MDTSVNSVRFPGVFMGRADAPLASVTAAIVHVIANIALFLIATIAYPAGSNGIFDTQSDWMALAVLAALAL